LEQALADAHATIRTLESKNRALTISQLADDSDRAQQRQEDAVTIARLEGDVETLRKQLEHAQSASQRAEEARANTTRERDNLRSQLHVLEEDMHRLESEARELRNRQNSSHDALRSKDEEMSARLSAAERQISDLRAQLMSREAELKSLAATSESKEADHARERARLQADASKWEASLTSATRDVEDARRQLDLVERQVASLEATLDNTHKEHSAALAAKDREWEQRLEARLANLSSSERERLSLVSRVEVLESQRVSLEAACANSAQSLAQMQSRVDMVEGERKTAVAAQHAAERQLTISQADAAAFRADAEREIANLHDALRQLQDAAHADASHLLEERDAAVARMRSLELALEAQVLEMRKVSASLETEKRRNADRVRDTDESSERLRSERDAAVRDYQQLLGKYVDIQTANGAAEAECNALKATLASVEDEANAYRTQADNRIATLERDCGVLQETIRTMNERHLAAQEQWEAQVSELSSQCAGLRNRCGELEREVVAAQNRARQSELLLGADVDSARQAAMRLEEERKEREEEVVRLRRALSKQESVLREVQERYDSLGKEYVVVRDNGVVVRRQLDHLQRHLAEREAAIGTASERHRNEVQQLSHERDSLTQQLQQTQQQLEALRISHEGLQRECAAVKQTLTQVQADRDAALASAHAERDRLSQDLAKSRGECQQLREESARTSRQIQQQLADTVEQRELLREELDHTRQLLDKARTSGEVSGRDWAARLAARDNEVTKWREVAEQTQLEMEKTYQELDAAQRTIDALQKENAQRAMNEDELQRSLMQHQADLRGLADGMTALQRDMEAAEAAHNSTIEDMRLQNQREVNRLHQDGVRARTEAQQLKNALEDALTTQGSRTRDLQERLQRAETECAAVTKHAEKLQNVLQSERREHAEALDNLGARLSGLARELSDSLSKNERHVALVGDLASQVEQMLAGDSLVIASIESLQQQHVSSMESLQNEKQSLQQTVAHLLDEKKALMDAVGEAQHNQALTMQQVQYLQSENDRLSQVASLVERDLNDARARSIEAGEVTRKEYTEKVEVLTQSLEQVQGQLHASQQQSARFETALNTKDREVNRLLADRQQMETQIAQLEQQIASMEARFREAEADWKASVASMEQQHEARIADLQHHIEELSGALAESKEQRAVNIRRLREEILESQERVQNVEGLLAVKERDCSTLERELQNALTSLSKREAACQAVSKLAEERQAALDATVQQWTVTKQQLQQQSESHKRSLQQLERDCEAKDKACTQLEAQLRESARQVSQMRAQQAELESVREHAASLDEELRALRDLAHRSQAESTMSRDDLLHTQQRAAHLEGRVTTLERELEVAKAESDRASLAWASQERQLSEAVSRADVQHREAVTHCETQMREMGSVIEQLQARLAQKDEAYNGESALRRREAEHAAKNHAAQQDRINSLERDVNVLQQALRDRESDIAKVREELSRISHECETVRDELAVRLGERDAAQREVEALRNTVRRLEEDVHRSRMEVQTLQLKASEDAEESKRQVEAVNARLESLQQANEAYAAQLRQANQMLQNALQARKQAEDEYKKLAMAVSITPGNPASGTAGSGPSSHLSAYYQETVASLQRRVQQLGSEVSMLQSQLTKAQSELEKRAADAAQVAVHEQQRVEEVATMYKERIREIQLESARKVADMESQWRIERASASVPMTSSSSSYAAHPASSSTPLRTPAPTRLPPSSGATISSGQASSATSTYSVPHRSYGTPGSSLNSSASYASASSASSYPYRSPVSSSQYLSRYGGH
jgi:chromosome segregation ATPase